MSTPLELSAPRSGEYSVDDAAYQGVAQDADAFYISINNATGGKGQPLGGDAARRSAAVSDKDYQNPSRVDGDANPKRPAEAIPLPLVAAPGSGPSAAPKSPSSKQPDPILQKSVELLRGNRGIVYGGGKEALHWVASNLESLKAAGVATVFLEIDRKHQSVINGSESKTELVKFLHDNGYADAIPMSDVIYAAKKNSLKVVAMDKANLYDGRITPSDRYHDPSQVFHFRKMEWNIFVRQEIKILPKEEKYLLVSGLEYTNKSPDFLAKGIDVSLGIPSIDIYEAHGINTVIENGLSNESDFVGFVPR